MPAYCSVADCMSNFKTSKNQGIQFHRLPKSPEHAAKWIKFCSKKQNSVYKNGFVCSRHFRDEDYDVIRIALTEDSKPKRILKKNVVPSIRVYSDKYDEVNLIEIEVDDYEMEEELNLKAQEEHVEEYIENEDLLLIEEELEEQPVPEPNSNLKQELNRAKDEISILKQQISNLQHTLLDKSQQMDSILAKVQELDNKFDNKSSEISSLELDDKIDQDNSIEDDIIYEVEYLESTKDEYSEEEECVEYETIEEIEDDNSFLDGKKYFEIEKKEEVENTPILSFSQLDNPKIDDITRMIDEIEKRNEELLKPKNTIAETYKVFQKPTSIPIPNKIIKPKLIIRAPTSPNEDGEYPPVVEYKVEYNCEECGKTFENERRFQKHQNTHAQPDGVKCPMCPSVFQFRSHCQRHFKDVHVLDQQTCEDCGKVFKNKKRLNIHRRQHEEIKRYLCKFSGCQKGFNSRTHLSNHMNVHTGNRPFACNQCEKTFKQSYALTLHLRRHVDITYSCEHCSSTFGSSAGRRRHVAKCNGKKTRGKYRMRENKEEVDYKFECFLSECKLKFSSKAILRNHLNDGHHLKTTDLTCLRCYTHFSDSVSLALHEKEHIINFNCHLCQKGFKLEQKYINHMDKYHSDPQDVYRPFSCDLCSASFKKLEHVRTHISYRHLNDRPFTCLECNKSFKFQCDLNAHDRKHKPDQYECRFCKFTASKSNGLRVHMQNIHGTEKIYQCDICLESFHYLEEMKRHKHWCTGEVLYDVATE